MVEGPYIRETGVQDRYHLVLGSTAVGDLAPHAAYLPGSPFILALPKSGTGLLAPVPVPGFLHRIIE